MNRSGGETQNWHSRKVLESIEECWDAIDELNMERLFVAEVENRYPQNDEDVLTAKIATHVHVMRLFRRLREPIKEHLSPEYWLQAPVYMNRRRAIVGLKSLEDYQGAIRAEEVRVDDEADHAIRKDTTRTELSAELLPAEGYTRAANLLVGAATKLGYIEPPSVPEPLHEVPAYPDVGPGYEEPEEYEPALPEEFDADMLDEPHYATPAVRKAAEEGIGELDEEEVTGGAD